MFAGLGAATEILTQLSFQVTDLLLLRTMLLQSNKNSKNQKGALSSRAYKALTYGSCYS